MAFIETTLPSASETHFAGSLHKEEYPYVGSQTFTTQLNYSTVFSIEVTGVGALSESQYTLNPPKNFTINDPLETGDFIVIIYGQANTGTSPYYSQAQTDLLLDDKEDKANKGIINGYASLDNTGKVPLSQLPPLAPTVPDATTTTKGIIKLAGDLGGTADLPTVPGLASKISGSGVANYIPKWISLSNVTNSQIIDNGNNILIGTTTDNGVDKLQVNGSALVNGLKYTRGIGVSGTNLNILTTAGFYVGNGMINAPSGNGDWLYITVEAMNADEVHQTVTTFGALDLGISNKIYSRVSRAGVWTPWAEMLTTTGTTSGAILNQTATVQTGGFNVSNDSKINGITVGRGSGNINGNTAIGFQSLINNTTGADITSIGWQSMIANSTSSFHTAIGLWSLKSITTGSFSTAIGHSALKNVTYSNSSVAIGGLAGTVLTDKITNVTSVNSSIFIGNRTSPLGDTQINQIVIGDDANGIGSNSVVLGNDSVTKTALKGNVLIGTTTDNGVDKLQVNGTISATNIHSPIETNIQSGTTYTLQNSDLCKQIIFTNASTITVTIPTGLTLGFNCEVLQQGTGQISITASGTTLKYSTFELPQTAEQNSLVAIDNMPNLTETYHLFGQLSAI